MKTVILSKPIFKVRIRVMPGSARIQVTFPCGSAAMFDPVFVQWHRAGPDQPNPVELLRHLEDNQLKNLETKLAEFSFDRYRNQHNGMRKRR
jgi:hypothetical protein